jgi:hypothetical protein
MLCSKNYEFVENCLLKCDVNLMIAEDVLRKSWNTTMKKMS